MALVALLFAHHGVAPDGEPPAALSIAGVTLIERQVALARDCGADRILVAVERMPPGLAAALARAEVEIVRASTGFGFADADRVVVIADGLLVDRRAVEAIAEAEPPTLAVWKGRAPHDGTERIDPSTHWGGVSLYSGRLINETLATLGDWDLQATLLRAAYGEARPGKINLASLATDDRHLTWQPIRSAADAEATTRTQLSARVTEARDWPSLLVNERLENSLVSALVAGDVEPKWIGAAGAVCAGAAAFGFACGSRWPSLVLALLAFPLISAFRKALALRRDRKSFSQTPEITAQIALIAGLAASFMRDHEPTAPAIAATLLALSIWGNFFVRRSFRLLASHSLDDAGKVEVALRRFGGMDSALLWSLLPFAAVGLWWWGYLWVTCYAAVTFVVSLVRMMQRLHEAQASKAAPSSAGRRRGGREPSADPTASVEPSEAAQDLVSGL